MKGRIVSLLIGAIIGLILGAAIAGIFAWIDPEISGVMFGIMLPFSAVIGLFVSIPVYNGMQKNKKKAKDDLNQIVSAFKKYGVSLNSKTLSYGSQMFTFDDEYKRLWFTNEANGYWAWWSFKKVKGCEVRINGTVSKTTGGLGRAVAGYVIAGGVGAVVGAATANRTTETENSRCELILYFDDLNNPMIKCDFTGKSGIDFADEVCATVQVIVDRKSL